ncbi:hypothetical protein HaLaN_22375 [Haematococcus lacustris]|uniref:Uncharacterized protein n=1 Tax=Haematococcus lacustris TaxID=44745 RepID=A0A699ZP05_HAELA|nr:hypothetical protein HaLaN_22375 [Haematococcus lacustris]
MSSAVYYGTTYYAIVNQPTSSIELHVVMEVQVKVVAIPAAGPYSTHLRDGGAALCQERLTLTLGEANGSDKPVWQPNTVDQPSALLIYMGNVYNRTHLWRADTICRDVKGTREGGLGQRQEQGCPTQPPSNTGRQVGGPRQQCSAQHAGQWGKQVAPTGAGGHTEQGFLARAWSTQQWASRSCETEHPRPKPSSL